MEVSLEIKQLIMYLLKKYIIIIPVSIIMALLISVSLVFNTSDNSYSHKVYYKTLSLYDGDSPQLEQYYAQTKTDKINSMLNNNNFFIELSSSQELKSLYMKNIVGDESGTQNIDSNSFISILQEYIKTTPTALAEIVEVNITAPDKEFADKLREEYNKNIFKVISNSLKGFSVEEVSSLYEENVFDNISVSKKSVALNFAVSFVVVLILICALYVAYFIFSGKIYSKYGISSRYTIPVIGTVYSER